MQHNLYSIVYTTKRFIFLYGRSYFSKSKLLTFANTERKSVKVFCPKSTNYRLKVLFSRLTFNGPFYISSDDFYTYTENNKTVITAW